MHRYTIVLDPDEDGVYTVTVPALPGVVTQGATLEEAVSMARDAIQLHLEGLAHDGLPIPQETVRPQVVIVEVAEPALSAPAD
jgi:antitoxin HicB